MRSASLSDKARHAATIFAVAYALNFIWEYAHYPLYICEWDRLSCAAVASIGDGLIILAVYALIAWVFGDAGWIGHMTGKQAILTLLIGFFAAWLIELRALAFDHWAYGGAMPIIPFLNVGLSPILQMLVLPLLTFWLVNVINVRMRP